MIEHVCVVGAGALGSVLAAKLEGVVPVTAVSRRGGAGDPMRVRDDAGEYEVAREPWAEFVPPAGATCYLLCMKAPQLDEALRTLHQKLRPGDGIVLAQNGLSVFLQAAQTIGRTAPMLRLLARFGALPDSDGSVQVFGDLAVSIASERQHTGYADRLREILSAAGFSVTVERDIATAEWNKALINLVVNPLCTIAGVRTEMLAKSPELFTLARAVYDEVIAVGRAEGFFVEPPSFETLTQGFEAYGKNFNSMLQDIRAGRTTENEYLLGRFLRIAEAYGNPTPVCRALHTLIAELEKR